MTERLRRVTATGNVVRFLLSFVLAFALWAWVTIENDPEQTYRASQVPVEAVNVPEGLELVGPIPAVNVMLQGPRSIVQDIDAGSISASVDLEDVSAPGRHDVPVDVSAPDNLRKVTSDPETVVVELGNVVSRSLEVQPITPEQPPRNLTVNRMTAEPRDVTVTGVQQNVDRVAQVIVPVDISGRNESFSFVAAPSAVDVNGDEVENVEVEPASVRVEVTIEVRGKVVPVFVDCICVAAEGFEVVGQALPVPNTVLIDGPAAALELVPYIFTRPVSTNQLTNTSVIEEVPLDLASLPEGVTVEPALVDVSVRIERATFTQTFEDVAIQVLNADDGTRVNLNPPTMDVTILGQRDAITSLAEGDLSIVIDVAGRGPGTYQLFPQVLLPPEMRYSDALPAVIVTVVADPATPAVTVVQSPTSTPSPTPRPEPAATP